MLDWDDLRIFLALARHGTLLAAAKHLHVAQSTVGRRIASLEASLAVRLLNRTPHGYVLTLAGENVRDHAERLEAEAHALESSVGGRDTRIAGLVRITCAETVADHILAQGLATLHQRHPEIVVEIIPDPRELSLSNREADIAVRLRRPDQHDLVVRRVGTMAFGLYASAGYLERNGHPDFGAGCAGHYLVTQLEDIQDATQTGWLTDAAPLAKVAIQTTSHEAAVAAATNGGGLACLARFRADRETALIRVERPPPVPTARIWLVVHRDNQKTPRIRAVLTHITSWVTQLRHDLYPADAEQEDEETSGGTELEVESEL